MTKKKTKKSKAQQILGTGMAGRAAEQIRSAQQIKQDRLNEITGVWSGSTQNPKKWGQ